MKVRNILILGALLGGGWYVYNTIKSTFDQLKFKFKKIKLDPIKFGQPLTGQIFYDFLNGSENDVVVQWFRGKLYYGNFFITNIIIKQTQVKATENKQSVLNISVPLLKLAGELVDLIRTKTFLNTFHIKGQLIFKVNNLPTQTVNVSQNIELAEKYNPNNE